MNTAEQSLDEIFAARRAADPWPILQQASVDQVKKRLTPLAERARQAIPIVKMAQVEGAACVKRYIDRELEILPVQISELSAACMDQFTVVESALSEFENLSVADAADELERFPTDPAKLEAIVVSIEARLYTVLNKECLIQSLIAQIETATRELAESKGSISAADTVPSFAVKIPAKTEGLSIDTRFDPRRKAGQ